MAGVVEASFPCCEPEDPDRDDVELVLRVEAARLASRSARVGYSIDQERRASSRITPRARSVSSAVS